MVRKIHTWIQQYRCGALAVIAVAILLLLLLPPPAAAAFLSIPCKWWNNHHQCLHLHLFLLLNENPNNNNKNNNACMHAFLPPSIPVWNPHWNATKDTNFFFRKCTAPKTARPAKMLNTSKSSVGSAFLTSFQKYQVRSCCCYCCCCSLNRVQDSYALLLLHHPRRSAASSSSFCFVSQRFWFGNQYIL